jgi:hypothetical protein
VPRVLYIAGYGRSGSTVLSTILGSHRDIAAVGELTHLLEDWLAPARVCACGASYSRCPFWGDLYREAPPPRALARLVRRIDASCLAAVVPAWRLSAADRAAYRESQRTVFEYVTSRTDKSIVVDSSKSARLAVGRPWSLTHLAGQDLYVLHLVRSGLATVDSLVTRGSNWALEGHRAPRRMAGVRGALGWTRANLWASLLGRRVGPARCMFMRYEDFLADPATWLRRIGEFVRFDADELVRRIEGRDAFVVSHLVGGNRLRMQQTVKLWLKTDTTAQAGLQRRHRLMFRLLGGWLERRYGYRAPGRGPAPATSASGR